MENINEKLYSPGFLLEEGPVFYGLIFYFEDGSSQIVKLNN